MTLAAPFRHRRRRLRHRRERGGGGEGRHTRLRSAAQTRRTRPPVRQERVRLRCRKGPLRLSPRRGPAPPGARLQGEIHQVRRQPSACNPCPLKTRCTKSKKGRWLRRSFEEGYLERVRGYGDTEPYRKALRKRQVWVEPLFGEAKDWHGSRRFRLRRSEKVNAAALLIAAGQNIKGLLNYGHRGPKGPGQVAALRQPAPNPYESCDVCGHHNKRFRRLARVFQHPAIIPRLRWCPPSVWGGGALGWLALPSPGRARPCFEFAPSALSSCTPGLAATVLLRIGPPYPRLPHLFFCQGWSRYTPGYSWRVLPASHPQS